MTILEKLESLDWDSLGASLVVIFGSVLCKGERARDIDLIIVPKDGLEGDEVAINVASVIESLVGIEADVYVATDPSNTNCFLFLEALKTGRIIHVDKHGRDFLVKTVCICNDFMVSRKIVRYTETLLRRVMHVDTR